MEENFIIKQLKTEYELCSGRQKEYAKRKLDCAKIVKCSPIREVLGDAEVDRLLRLMEARPKECYRNAALVAMLSEGVEYVEGYYGVAGIFGAEHAWNRVGDKYFDITAELVLGADVTQEHYVQVMAISADEMTNLIFGEECFTWLFGVKFAQEMKKQENTNK